VGLKDVTDELEKMEKLGKRVKSNDNVTLVRLWLK